MIGKTCHMVHLPKCTTVWQLDCKVVAKLSLSPRSEVIAMEHRRDKLGLSFPKNKKQCSRKAWTNFVLLDCALCAVARPRLEE